jgi:UvrB/UvrC motif-containing protein
VSLDITRILEGWEFEPDQISVRIVIGADGREKIQMRLELGLLQMELNGRPDGQRPEGVESWLEFYRQRQLTHEAAHPDSAPPQLETADCERLLREGIQYYHRYLSFWHLKRYELCARDTTRNLRLFKFVREHARLERDKRQFDQWRPYVTMMHTRAVATPLVEMGDIETGLKAIDAGIKGIREFLEEYGQTERAGQCAELLHLERWREELLAQRPEPPPEPPDLLTQLRSQLDTAVLEERFEEAAQLRDEIRRLSESPFNRRSDEKL